MNVRQRMNIRQQTVAMAVYKIKVYASNKRFYVVK